MIWICDYNVFYICVIVTYELIYVSGCGNVIFHFGSNKLWKTVPTFGYMWKHTLRHLAP